MHAFKSFRLCVRVHVYPKRPCMHSMWDTLWGCGCAFGLKVLVSSIEIMSYLYIWCVGMSPIMQPRAHRLRDVNVPSETHTFLGTSVFLWLLSCICVVGLLYHVLRRSSKPRPSFSSAARNTKSLWSIDSSAVVCTGTAAARTDQVLYAVVYITDCNCHCLEALSSLQPSYRI